MRAPDKKVKRVAFFGHFNSTNLGNAATLQAIVCRIRRFQPDAEFVCISTDPVPSVATTQIKHIPISEGFLKFWSPRGPVGRLLRKILVGLPSEPYRWIKGVATLRRTDVLIVPGTGLLTDAAGLRNEGPYSLLKWALIAKSCGCKVFFVSVGAGPIHGILGRLLLKAALALADFRSYRDQSSRALLKTIGLSTDNDAVYPDLAFSLCETSIPNEGTKAARRPVVGLGLMTDSKNYGIAPPGEPTHRTYLETLAMFAKWLLAHGYDLRLFVGDLLDDMDVMRDFRSLLMPGLSVEDADRVIEDPVNSVESLLSQMSKSDFLVATRFHNVILGLLCNKPLISISFHQKCDSLMSSVGLSAYCLSINDLTVDGLVDKFGHLTNDAAMLKSQIGERAQECRKALDEQYATILRCI